LVNASSSPAPPLRSVAPEVDARIARLVDRALESSQDKRWSSAMAMAEGLRKVYQDVSGHPIREAKLTFAGNGSVPPARSKRGLRRIPTAAFSRRSPSAARRKGVAIGGAVILGLLLAGAVLVLSGGHTEGRAQATSSPLPVPAPDVTLPEAPREIVELPPPSAPAIIPDARPPFSVSDPPVIAAARTSAPRRSTPKATVPAAPPISAATISIPPFSTTETSTPPVFATETSSPSPSAEPSAISNALPACEPPYVVDPTTGKKHWKLQCL